MMENIQLNSADLISHEDILAMVKKRALLISE